MGHHVQLVSVSHVSLVMYVCHSSCVNLAVLKSNGNSAFPLFFVSWVGVLFLFSFYNEELFFLIRYLNGYL